MNALTLWFHRIGSPPTFYRLAGALAPWCYGVALLLGAVALYGGLVLAPRDYQQGDAYRIIFVHVPCAWMGLFAYLFMAANAFVALVWHIKLSEILAMASAPAGAAFTFASGTGVFGTSESVPLRPESGLRAVLDAELREHRREVGLHRAVADPQPPGDLLVRQSCRDQAKDLPLARRESRSRVVTGTVTTGSPGAQQGPGRPRVDRGLAPAHGADPVEDVVGLGPRN